MYRIQRTNPNNGAKDNGISYVELGWFCSARFRDAATGCRVTPAADVTIGRLSTSGPGRRSIRKSRRGDEQMKSNPTHQPDSMGPRPTCCSSERRTCMAWLPGMPRSGAQYTGGLRPQPGALPSIHQHLWQGASRDRSGDGRGLSGRSRQTVHCAKRARHPNGQCNDPAASGGAADVL